MKEGFYVKINRKLYKTGKIDGKIYNTSPSANYRHSIVNGNIYVKLREGLKGLCLTFMENLDYRYHAEEEDYNADTIITVRDFPYITMTFAEVFENVK